MIPSASLRAPDDAGVVLDYANPDLACGHSEDVFFILWRGTPSVANVAALEECFAKCVAARAAPVALLTTITRATRMPEGEGKRRLASFARFAGEKVFLSALLCEGDRFETVKMGFVTGSLTVVARQSYPHRNFSNLDETATWLEANSAASLCPLHASKVTAGYLAFRELADRTPPTCCCR